MDELAGADVHADVADAAPAAAEEEEIARLEFVEANRYAQPEELARLVRGADAVGAQDAAHQAGAVHAAAAHARPPVGDAAVYERRAGQVEALQVAPRIEPPGLAGFEAGDLEGRLGHVG